MHRQLDHNFLLEPAQAAEIEKPASMRGELTSPDQTASPVPTAGSKEEFGTLLEAVKRGEVFEGYGQAESGGRIIDWAKPGRKGSGLPPGTPRPAPTGSTLRKLANRNSALNLATSTTIVNQSVETPARLRGVLPSRDSRS